MSTPTFLRYVPSADEYVDASGEPATPAQFEAASVIIGGWADHRPAIRFFVWAPDGQVSGWASAADYHDGGDPVVAGITPREALDWPAW